MVKALSWLYGDEKDKFSNPLIPSFAIPSFQKTPQFQALKPAPAPAPTIKPITTPAPTFKTPQVKTPAPQPIKFNPMGPLKIPSFNQPAVDNRPYPMRVPGTIPTLEQQVKYAPKPNSLYKGHDLSGLNNDNLIQARQVIDKAVPGANLNPYLTSVRTGQDLKAQSDYDNSIPGKILNFIGGIPDATGKVAVGAVNSAIDTAKLPADLIMGGVGRLTGNKDITKRADTALNENWNNSIPGGILKGMEAIGKPLGASIAYNEQYDKITKDPNTSPEMKQYLLADLENSVNQETADVGVNTRQSTLENAIPIAMGALSTATTVALTPGMIETLMKFSPSNVVNSLSDNSLQTKIMAGSMDDLQTAISNNDTAALRSVADRITVGGYPDIGKTLNGVADAYDTAQITKVGAGAPAETGIMPVTAPATPLRLPSPAEVPMAPVPTPTVPPVAAPVPSVLAQQIEPVAAPRSYAPMPAGKELTSNYIKVGYPNAADLPPDVQNTLQKSTNFSNKTNIADRIAANKLTPRDVNAVTPNNQFTQSDIRTLADNIPEFKQNPVMTFNPEGTVNGYNGTRPTFEYEANGQKMSFDAQNMLPEGSDLSKLKAGEQVDFSQAIQKGNNKIPAITESKPGEVLPGTTPGVTTSVPIKNEPSQPAIIRPKKPIGTNEPVSDIVKKPASTAKVTKNVPAPITDETGAPRPIVQPKAITEELNRTKQKALADRKRGLEEIRRIVGPQATKEVYTITNPNAKAAGVYKPQDSRIGIKGIGKLETYRHEAMHKAFAENLTPEQQGSVFKAILRENGVKNADFAKMTDSEISALIGNADEKLNYSLSKYIEDTNNIKDPELKQYFKDIMDGKYAGRQKQNAKVWSQTGVDTIKKSLQSEGGTSYAEIAPKVKTPSEKTARQVAGQIGRNTKANADYTPNRELANATVGNKFMNKVVDRTTAFTQGLKRMDENQGITNGMGSKIDTMLKERNNVQNRVMDEIRTQKGSSISKFIESMKTENLGDTKAKMDGFSEYLKIKSTINDKNAGLEYNPNYDKPKQLAKLEGKYTDEYKAYQDVFATIREDISPFLTKEAKDAMDHNPDYIPMRRDFTDSETANMFLGKAKVSENVTARQGVIKSKQGGSQREILNPVDTMLSMYTAAKQSALDNNMISGIADPRYGFKRIGKYTPVPDGMVKMTYFKDGTTHSIAVPKEWGAALAPRVPKVLTTGKIGKVLHAATVPVRAAATGYNIGFQVVNPLRDAGSNIIRTDQTARFITSLPKGIVSAFSGHGELYTMAKRNGIVNNTRYSSELNKNPVNVLSEVMKSSGAKGIVLDAVKHPINTLKQALNVSENIVRLGEFDAQLRTGRSRGLTGKALEEFATTQANKHLPDYSKSGTATAIINEYHPYTTASIAGVRPLARAFKERPVQTTAKVVAMIAASTALALAQMRDKKTGDAYNSVTDDEKNHNITLVMSDKVGADNRADTVKIPLSPDLYAFNTMGNKLAKLINGTLNGDDTGNMFEEIVNSATPINVATGKGESPIYSAFQSLAPTVVNATIQTSFGVNYKGKQQYDTYAPEWAKTISDAVGKVLTPAQVNQVGTSLLGNFSNPEKLVNVQDRFSGSYVNSGTPVNTNINGADVKVYKPENSSIKRIKAAEGDWYEVTAGNDLAKDNGKIKRLDEQTPVYNGSVEGLNKQDVNMLSMTSDEVTRDLKSNKYDGTISYLTALKNAEDRDVATKDTTHDYYGGSLTTTQALAVAKVNKTGNYDYKFQNLYDKTDLTEWRDMGDPESESYDPEMYQKLYNYDSERAKVDASGKSSDNSKNKYSVKTSGSGGAGSAASRAAAAAKALLEAAKDTPTKKLSTGPTVTKATYRQVPVTSSSKTTATNKYAPIKVSAKSSASRKDRSMKNEI